jgi:formyl-CoA transferase
VGEVTVTNNPIKLSDTKTSIRRPAPMVGEHNEQVYGQWLGLSPQELKKLEENGII